MDRNGVDKAVLTQVLGLFDNGYQRECVLRFPGRLASVGAVNPAEPHAPDEVRRWADAGMVGLRLRPEARGVGSDPLAIWRAADERGLVISCGGSAANVMSADFAALVADFPDLAIVIEQLGGWTRPDCDGTAETWRGILALARFPNVALKVPTLGQLVPRQIGTPLPPTGPVLDKVMAEKALEALHAFGPGRLLWGSDFPVVSAREGYANALNWTRDIFAGEPQATVDAIFGRNADRLFFAQVA
jgi:L-fuconolactonase